MELCRRGVSAIPIANPNFKFFEKKKISKKKKLHPGFGDFAVSEYAIMPAGQWPPPDSQHTGFMSIVSSLLLASVQAREVVQFISPSLVPRNYLLVPRNSEIPITN